jgi:hypothetical protein
VCGQEKFAIPKCNRVERGRYVGERIVLPLPAGAKRKVGSDVDYSQYSVAFRKGKSRVYMTGIYGPLATSGQIPKYMASENVASRRNWNFGETEGVDAAGTLANGNYWRYFGTYGESVQYYDISKEAATYFDQIMDSACYNPPN